MKLDSLMSYKTSFQLTKIILLVIIVCFAASMLVAYLYMSNKIAEVQSKVKVIDRKGVVYESETKNAASMRIYEYEDHVKTFYKLWYAFDENSYKANIEQGLHMVGDCGKDLMDNYKGEEVENKLRTKNLVLKISITNIKIDMTTIPISGFIEGVQTITRNLGQLSRNMNCTFNLYDVDRSALNTHGCKIENWKVVNSSAIQDNGTK